MDDNGLLAVSIVSFVAVAVIKIVVTGEDGAVVSMALGGIMSILGFLVGRRRERGRCNGE